MGSFFFQGCDKLGAMALMLPTPRPSAARLADVMSSSLAALRGEDNPLSLPAVRSAIVVMVDGLGVHNLKSRAGHARNMMALMNSRSVAQTVFPATTAAAIASLTTGQMPGQHGIVGYTVRDPRSGGLINQLNGWGDRIDPATWQRIPTVFERVTGAEQAFAVGHPKYADSGFSKAVLRGAHYVNAPNIDDRINVAIEKSRDGSSLIYVYFPELDMAAHQYGWQSDRWTAALESVDAAFARLVSTVGPDVGVILTADHGVVDVPHHRHVALESFPRELWAGVSLVAGDPRCVYLYTNTGISHREQHDLLNRWREHEEQRSWVFSRQEGIEEGLWGEVASEVVPRLGHIIVAARSGIAYYDRRTASTQAQRMIGQHGSVTDEETRVPLLRAAAFE